MNLPQLPPEIWSMILSFKRKFHFNQICVTLHKNILIDHLAEPRDLKNFDFLFEPADEFNFGEACHIFNVRRGRHDFTIRTHDFDLSQQISIYHYLSIGHKFTQALSIEKFTRIK